MSWFDGLLSTDGAVDPSKIAAWIGCIGVLWSALKKTICAINTYRDKPRIATPQFSLVHSIKHPRAFASVSIANIGRVPMEIELVRLQCYPENSGRYTFELSSDEDGPLPPRRNIDKDSTRPKWKRQFYVRMNNVEIEKAAIRRILDMDLQALCFEIWVKGRDYPIWTGKGEQLSVLMPLLKDSLEWSDAAQLR